MALIVVQMVLLAACACVALGVGERGDICRSGEAKCIWLNDHLDRRGGFPVHSSVCPRCKADVYCYECAFTWSKMLQMWDSIYITIGTTRPNNLAVFSGNSSKKHTLRVISSSSVQHLNPFKTYCVGVVHAGGSASRDNTEYSIDAHFKLWPGYPALAAVGLLLLFRAPKLSKNVPLIYGTGITLGILMSALVVLYVLSRYLPGKNFVGLGVLAGGYAAVMAVAYWALDHVAALLLEHWEYVLGYVCVTGCLSFAAIYWWGGVNNPRTFDLIQWGLQLFALMILYLANASVEMSLVLLAVVLVTYNVPIRWNPLMLPLYLCYCLLWYPVRWCWEQMRHPPAIPVRRLLTMEEYEEQGKRETAKELSKLQEYCREHEEVLEDVKDTSRSRLGKFVQTGKDVTEEERVNHDWALMEESDSEEDDASFHSRGTPSSLHGSPSHRMTRPHWSAPPISHPVPRYRRDYLNTVYHTSPGSTKYSKRQ